MISPWLLADPARNYQFSRFRPPDPDKQRRHPWPEMAPRTYSQPQNDIEISALLRHAARLSRRAWA